MKPNVKFRKRVEKSERKDNVRKDIIERGKDKATYFRLNKLLKDNLQRFIGG